MDLSTLKYADGSRKKRKRVGRGQGSGHGGTSCRGHKGARSRAGYKRKPGFEGGQTPMARRLPKRGFFNRFSKEFQIINLQDLERIKEIKNIDPQILYDNGLIRKKAVPVKVLGVGELNREVEISAHAFSKSAQEKIEAAKGRISVL
ncbi:50S ribosomal protein L15 [candidate division KSB1 bacterium]|nr:50S ribosomal protein L15 [candidate division KSB1 bacterium]MBL7095005.1 50S ribosomal protein L15 [candidate division KSB1 bacterium]